jgi:hypothetical protein
MASHGQIAPSTAVPNKATQTTQPWGAATAPTKPEANAAAVTQVSGDFSQARYRFAFGQKS